MRKHRFVSYCNSEINDDALWDYWTQLQSIIDQEENKYNWNRMYMIRNIEELVIMVNKKTDQVEGFYMATLGPEPKRTEITKVAPKKNRNIVSDIKKGRTKVASKKDRTNIVPDINHENRMIISVIQSFVQGNGHGTLMLIHAARKAGMKYHNTSNLKNYLVIQGAYEEAIGFYKRYDLDII